MTRRSSEDCQAGRRAVLCAAHNGPAGQHYRDDFAIERTAKLSGLHKFAKAFQSGTSYLMQIDDLCINVNHALRGVPMLAGSSE